MELALLHIVAGNRSVAVQTWLEGWCRYRQRRAAEREIVTLLEIAAVSPAQTQLPVIQEPRTHTG